MQYSWKVYKYENGKKSTDLTEYLTVPIFMEPHLDETLGTGEIILDRVPTKILRTALPPKTKIRIERYFTKDFSGFPTTYDFVVDSDQVEEYAGCPEFCCHRIELIEPSVIAQGMHVDNISLTRELNDVTLEYRTIKPSEDLVTVNVENVYGDGYERPNLDYNKNKKRWEKTVYSDGSFGLYSFTNSFRYVWSDYEEINNLIACIDGRQEKTITFKIPTLKCYHNAGGVEPVELFECPTKTLVYECRYKKNKIFSRTLIKEQKYNPTDIPNLTGHEYEVYSEDGKVGLCYIPEEKYEDSINEIKDLSYRGTVEFFPLKRVKKLPAMIDTTDKDHTEKTVTFPTTSISQGDLDNGDYYKYEIEFRINPYESGGLISSFTSTSTAKGKTNYWKFWSLFVGSSIVDVTWTVKQIELVSLENSQVTVSTSFLSTNMAKNPQSVPFTTKPKKYSCFNLVRKALLTTDTQIIDNEEMGLDDIQYPIIIDSEWEYKLKNTQLYETIFEEKNLWEIFLQVGYYLHAIPQLKFATDGTDRFLLSFRQLGGTKENDNKSTKINIFNSYNLSEYFTSLDSYVTNIFSPQNEIEEWLVPKTSDSTYLVSNDTMELHTKYNISQIDEFYIKRGDDETSALEYIFEKSVYNTLTSRKNVTPGKWKALYYELGTDIIQGMTFTPLSKNNDAKTALKNIYDDLFEEPKKYEFNKLLFHIKYKTQDSLRISQVKPNLCNYLKNSRFEKYPHHEQFYGQQDKIVDSERFSANLWGRLVRMANGVYQCNEYADIGEEKEVGDLVNINDDTYYVTAIEEEYYNDCILQKVTYSKDYNQISQVVTIPSEPRFYEISERSMVRREVRLADFLLLTTNSPSDVYPNSESVPPPRFINGTMWTDFVLKTIFSDGEYPNLPNFAYTKYKADEKKNHLQDDNQTVDCDVLFPSSEPANEESETVGLTASNSRGVIVPLLHFPLKNAIIFEWDMEDNFKAGDAIDTKNSVDADDGAYYSLQPVRYCDVMGGADLFSFYLFFKNDWTHFQSQRLPFAEKGDFIPKEEDSLFYLSDKYSIGLDKDNREALSFNYQINLLTDGDSKNQFITFSNLFGKKSGKRLKMCFLNKTVSIFSETVSMTVRNILVNDIEYELSVDDSGAVKLTIPDDVLLLSKALKTKSIVLYDEEDNLKYVYLARNVDGLEGKDIIQPWYIFPVFAKDDE